MDRQDHLIKLRDGRKLGYCEYGDPKGKPVFYFHGWPASRFSGSETNTAAGKLGIRIISPDRPGIGLSDYLENRTLLGWADDVAELADNLKIKKFAVLGTSGGGPYTAVCCFKLPDKITKAAIVAGLGPVNVPGILKGVALLPRLSWENYHHYPQLRLLGAIVAAVEFKYLPVIGRYAGFQAKEDRLLLKTKFKNTGFHAAKEAYRQGIKGPETELRIYTDDWGFKLSDIRTKVDLWYGAKDRSVSPETGKYYHAQIKNSELFMDPDSGHLGRYEYEEKILKKLIS